jgi:nucleotide-binding universal stress UspA family protein
MPIEPLAQKARTWHPHRMSIERTIHEQGHRRKFLVVVDETSECDRAITYAAWRASSTGGAIIMMAAIQPDHFQHWLGVKEIMKAEAHEEAQEKLAQFKERIEDIVSVPTECVIREGKIAEQITALIEEDKDIGILVLAAAVDSKEGPGPLVSSISGQAGQAFPIPVTIVPGDLSDEDIRALA